MSSPEEIRLRKIRKRLWYKRWIALIDTLREGGIRKICFLLYEMLDGRSTFGSIEGSNLAEESLELALQDKEIP